MNPFLPPFAVIGLGAPELLIVLLMLSVVPAIMGFWIWMLVDCITQEKESDQKIPWVLVIIFTHILGALIYFFVRKLNRNKQANPPLAPPPLGVPR